MFAHRVNIFYTSFLLKNALWVRNVRTFVSSLKKLAPLANINVFSRLDRLPSDGAQCPIVGCKERVFNMYDFQMHRTEKHTVTTKGPRKNLVHHYTCRDPKCAMHGKIMTYKTFELHVRTEHSLPIRCLSKGF